MTKSELEKGIEEYKQKTDLFPHPKIVSKNRKNKKNIKTNLPKER